LCHDTRTDIRKENKQSMVSEAINKGVREASLSSVPLIRIYIDKFIQNWHDLNQNILKPPLKFNEVFIC
jgi:hypothetical protein